MKLTKKHLAAFLITGLFTAAPVFAQQMIPNGRVDHARPEASAHTVQYVPPHAERPRAPVHAHHVVHHAPKHHKRWHKKPMHHHAPVHHPSHDRMPPHPVGH